MNHSAVSLYDEYEDWEEEEIEEAIGIEFMDL